MGQMRYTPQSSNWGAVEVLWDGDDDRLPEAPAAWRVHARVAKDGNLTVVALSQDPEGPWWACEFVVRGEWWICSPQRGCEATDEDRALVHYFGASSGSWSGGSNLRGLLLMRPGALMCHDAKGCRYYLCATESGIEKHKTDPRLFSAPGPTDWEVL